MGSLDRTLFIIFGSLVLLGLTGAILCFRMALRVAGDKDGDLKMFFWAMGTLFSLIVAGASAGYILIPIIFHE